MYGSLRGRVRIVGLGVALPLVAAGVGIAAPGTASADSGTTTVSFTTPGCSTWQVPDGVSSVQIQATGAAGRAAPQTFSAGAPGKGDGVSANLGGLSGGQTLDVCVDVGGGGGGRGGGLGGGLLFNDSGTSYISFPGGNGGGASGVSLGTDFSAPVLVAGGGGGASSFGGLTSTGGSGGSGGNAGMPVAGGGQAPYFATFPTAGGGGGGDNTNMAGGGGGVGDPGVTAHISALNQIFAGAGINFGTGDGGAGTGSTMAGPGGGGAGGDSAGGGGAGYFGGGGGGTGIFPTSSNADLIPGAGGGGGTDFCPDSTSLTGCAVSSGAGTGTGAGSATGDAQVSLTFADVSPALPTAATHTWTTGASDSLTVNAVGTPAPTIVHPYGQPGDGKLPNGLTLSTSPGSATISGTPYPDAGGTYKIKLVATNSEGADTHYVTVTVQQAPVMSLPTNGGTMGAKANTASVCRGASMPPLPPGATSPNP